MMVVVREEEGGRREVKVARRMEERERRVRNEGMPLFVDELELEKGFDGDVCEDLCEKVVVVADDF